MKTTIHPVTATYGAPMGRREHDSGAPGKLHLRRVRINSGGYDDGGAYWGIGQPLFECFDGDDFNVYLRARDREAAKAKIRSEYNYPDAKFYR